MGEKYIWGECFVFALILLVLALSFLLFAVGLHLLGVA